MNYIINPNYYNITKESRIVLYDKEAKEFYKKELVKGRNIYRITDELINKNPHQFIYKIQVKESDVWTDQTSYNDINQYDYDLFSPFMLGKIKLTDTELDKSVMGFYYHYCNSKSIHIKRFLYGFINNLWNTQNVVHPNINQYLSLISSNDSYNTNSFWNNFNKFLIHLTRLKRNLIALNLQNLFFYELKQINYNINELEVFLKNEIDVLNDYELPFTDLLSAIYHSFLNNRNDAYKLFEIAINKDKFNMEELIIGQGIYTYKNYLSENQSANLITIDNDAQPSEANTIFLMSVDAQFLRKYFSQLISSIIALKSHHFHIHIVSDNNTDKEIELLIQEAKLLMYNSLKFRDFTHKVIMPTFSYEHLTEDINLKTTYYACSRYIHAEQLMSHFNKDIYIMDIDLFVINELKNYVNSISKYDIALAFSRGLISFTPWRRILAGNLYLKNNDNSKEFLNYAKSYILSHISEPNSWTLDQNALSYAYEKIIDNNPNIKIGNLNNYKRPLAQHPIRKKYEED